MRLDRAITLYAADPIQRWFPRSTSRRVRILMYHRISDESEPGLRPYYRLNTSPARFAQQMQFLADAGYRVIDLPTALESLAARAEDQKQVVITFDDGFADFAEHAAPVLRRHRFSATVFLPTAFISESRRRFKSIDCLTWSEVRDLRAHSIQFGSHTVSHPKLHSLEWPEVERELSESKQVMEDRLQEPVTSFAHPYAFPEMDAVYVRRFSSALKRNGYKCGVTTRIGIAGPDHDLWSLKRLPVNDSDDHALFRAKLEGAYDWLGVPQRLAKRLKSARQKTPELPLTSDL